MEKLQLTFSASSLPNVTTLGAGQIDPFLAVFQSSSLNKDQQLVGYTEAVMNTQSPNWASHFTINYSFEVAQQITVKIYHKDGGTPVGNSSHHTYMGTCTFSLPELMTNTSRLFQRSFVDGTAKASDALLTVRGEAVATTRDIFIGKFQASGLNRMNGLGIFGKSDPFMVISKMFEDGSYGVAWKSTHIKSELNPHFPECHIPMVALCNGDVDRPLKIEFFDFEDSGKHKFMGALSTSIRALMRDGSSGIDILEPEKVKAGGSYKNSGRLKCIDCIIEHHPTFTEYISGGMEVSLMVAIDYTASNGDPKEPHSLHHINPHALNSYQSAIMRVGEVIEPYDSDKLFQVWGFGARVKDESGNFSPVQHCFTLQDNAKGVSGVLAAYEESLKHVGFSGPTLFGNLIDTAGAVAASTNCSQASQKYHILLIITDGIINDMDATKAAITRASSTPLSIIVVGVGAEDFSQMKTLDSDDVLLSTISGKHKSERDIVQFVAFRDFVSKPDCALAQEVLAEVPNQVLSFMAKRGIVPNKKSA